LKGKAPKFNVPSGIATGGRRGATKGPKKAHADKKLRGKVHSPAYTKKKGAKGKGEKKSQLRDNISGKKERH